MNPESDQRDDLDRYLLELVAAGLVEIIVGPAGEVRYRRARFLRRGLVRHWAGHWREREDLDG